MSLNLPQLSPSAVADGIVYLSLQDGSMNVFTLSHYKPHVPARQHLPMGEDLVLIALQDGSVDALRARSGLLLWHRAMNS